MTASSAAVLPQDAPAIEVEAPRHAAAVEALVDRAFGPGRFAKSSERLREGNRKLDDCSFVALRGDQVIGSVRLWPVTIGGKPVAFLGPLAVDATQRSAGLGQALVETACAAAAKAGWKAVLLVGDAPYFARIGFSAAPAAKVVMPGPADQRRVLLKALVSGGDEGFEGRVAVA
ncbi:N-acetyltransferase [Caulobacter sp. D4A]|uniref:GNAT family N-acetyltransferase n=1 Tax=unclassified Caulobacter TaxID=2648921 RepID=UPI000D73162A|nr:MULTISPECIES: N-acetyltransferase [unclassified Caulobacter]PXA86326.1 N-acetyltransferase [Caulobacter sp. D4A]PXA90466.1 N-acetyltransferase [Caulobacter sp. D5]